LRILGRVIANANKTIWLVGMMGAGKSTVGRALARHLSLPFIDTDHRLEAEVIRELGQKPQIVALGGGAPAQPGMVEYLQEHGTMVYLRAGLDTLLERIGDARTRPMLRDLSPEARAERLTTLQREREPSYSRAPLTIDADASSTAAVVDEIVEKLKALYAG